jgi:hypothetical protein
MVEKNRRDFGKGRMVEILVAKGIMDTEMVIDKKVFF